MGGLDWVTLYDVDDIQRAVARNEAQRAEEARHADVLVRQEVSRFLSEQAVREGLLVLARLRQRAERIARAEVERTLAAVGEGLSARQRKSLEAMARAIVNKLLHEPTARLRAGASGEENPVLSEFTARLFGLTEA